MSRNRRRLSSWGPVVESLTVLVFWLGVGSKCFAKKGEAEEGPRVRIHVFNLARVSKWDLADGESLATTIFHQARVELIWLDCPFTQAERGTRSGCPPLGPMDLTLRILPGSIARRLDMSDLMLGLTPATAETGPGDNVIISYQRVLFVSAVSGVPPAGFLGLGMAHEIGHVLLHSLEHSPRGIMRARLQPEDLESRNVLNVLFTPEQAEVLRERVLARMKKAGGGQN